MNDNDAAKLFVKKISLNLIKILSCYFDFECLFLTFDCFRNIFLTLRVVKVNGFLHASQLIASVSAFQLLFFGNDGDGLAPFFRKIEMSELKN